MHNVIQRALEVWEHIARNVAYGPASIDSTWTEELFVTEFIKNEDNFSIVVVGDGASIYDDEHCFIVTRDEAMNLNMVNKDEDFYRPICKDRWPIFEYKDGERRKIGSFASKKEAYHTERQLVINNLSSEMLAYKMGGVGIPVIPVDAEELRSVKNSCYETPTSTMVRDTKQLIMVDKLYEQTTGDFVPIPEGTIIATSDMLNVYLERDDIDFELIGSTEVEL